MTSIDFFAEGIPRTKGSSFSFLNPKTNKIVYQHDNKHLKSWQLEVKLAAKDAGLEPTEGPIELEIIYCLPRPKAHYNTAGQVKSEAPKYPICRPDVDKMERAILDALTGTAYNDDSQVVKVEHEKLYTDNLLKDPGAYVTVRQL